MFANQLLEEVSQNQENNGLPKKRQTNRSEKKVMQDVGNLSSKQKEKYKKQLSCFNYIADKKNKAIHIFNQISFVSKFTIQSEVLPQL